MKRSLLTALVVLTSSALFAGGKADGSHKTVAYVDMEKFSGDWYVIALIPTSFEKGASNGIENYSLDNEGNIRIRYSFTRGGKNKTMYQKGWIYNGESNAEWRVMPLWPLKLPYYVIELDDAYSYTAVTTTDFKYLWIMARTPVMDAETLKGIISRMVERGFNESDIVYMEQKGNGA
jgi:apolipoprotein D and lipocalin family protein